MPVKLKVYRSIVKLVSKKKTLRIVTVYPCTYFHFVLNKKIWSEWFTRRHIFLHMSVQKLLFEDLLRYFVQIKMITKKNCFSISPVNRRLFLTCFKFTPDFSWLRLNKHVSVFVLLSVQSCNQEQLQLICKDFPPRKSKKLARNNTDNKPWLKYKTLPSTWVSRDLKVQNHV